MKKLFKVLLIIVAVFTALIIITFTTQAILTQIEKKDCQTSGKFVEVNGRNMSISILGSGRDKIVLLPGLGTAAPILDFEPFAQELSKDFTVITVEPFGYGWSDITSEERTIENEVSELHEALKKSGITGPYILAAHSIYGIDALQYINQYPDEVKGFIGIDCTLPQMPEYFNEALPESMPLICGDLHKLGLIRLLNQLAPESYISSNEKNLYSDQNLKMQSILVSAKGQNRNVVDQLNHIPDSMTKTKELTFPDDMPILFFTRTRDQETRSDHKTSKSFYETYITNPAIQSVITYEAGHYMHWTCSKEMSNDIIMSFKKNASM